MARVINPGSGACDSPGREKAHDLAGEHTQPLPLHPARVVDDGRLFRLMSQER